MNPLDYEKLGAFYLGRALDPVTGQLDDAPLLYPSKHLVTHGVIVGMTGSGKTGLGVVLLEEAALDGIPAIVVDPKGDLANLLLTFPSLDPREIAPWAAPGEDPVAIAERHARGLEGSGQSVDRIRAFAGSVERTVYTPGSSAGRPLAMVPSLEAPPGDPEAVRDRAVQAATSLLVLAGVDPDPRAGPEHTLVANVILAAWGAGRSLDVSSMIRELQRPPFDRIGALDLESVISTKDRAALASRLNNAFASPAFADFLSGEPLDAGKLLYTKEGRPRLSVLSIAHLADAERMAFVTTLLGELLRWMRTQAGTSSLRALFYMDEVFGYFPPVAAPPAKAPMLTLLKQARAFGLGIVLATQNPVDLDYKGLANAGTWMLGRLPTERDKMRVLEGLEGASAASGTTLDRAVLDRALSGLRPRSFVLHDVNEPAPRMFETRWALSYLRGPLSREELRKLARPAPVASAGAAPVITAPAAATSSLGARPALPADVPECFVVRTDVAGAAYRPGVLCRASLRYVHAKSSVDTWRRPTLVAPLGDDGPRWSEAWVLESEPATTREPAPGASFAPLPAAAMRAATFATWKKAALLHLVRERPLSLAAAPALGLIGLPGEANESFVARVTQTTRERRDREVEALAAKWQPKIERAREKLERAREKLEDATADRNTSVLASGLEVGATVLGAMFGRRSALRGAASVATKARRAQKKHVDSERAQAEITERAEALKTLERDLAEALSTLRKSWDPSHVEIEERLVAPRKADVTIERFELAWVPVAT